MRIEIASLDRVGITQEILAVFAMNNWDLLAMEVSQYHIYVQLKDTSIPLAIIEPELIKISGLKAIRQIELLPGERKSQQLEVLLANIPEPIIDIDKNGLILMVNKAASVALGMSAEQLINEPLTNHIKEKLRIYLSGQSTTQEVTFANQQYFADITPVMSDESINGAVIVLRSLANVGRHLSQYQQGQVGGFDSIIGNSETIKQIKSQTKRFSSLDLPVLITGETGTGKELLAKALHDNGSRSSKPFLAINCAALPEHLLESELFGYAPGAFTGAQSAGKPGLFELANGGSVFLDEIAEMPVYLQAKLLRFLQDFKIRRVGGVKDRKVDVRIISATHQNIAEQVQQKQFREDLYYRLNVLNLDLPTLNKRADDIPLLVEHFINNAAKQVNQSNINLSPAALEKVCAYSWPGNVRQLQNVLFRVAALAEKNIIDEHDIVFDEQLVSQTDELDFTGRDVESWHAAQQKFEQGLLNALYPLYPSTRKLAERLKVSHNKVAMKLRQYKIK
ncbi:sigma 54-interacting transcriptional regulator [Thalassotalea nanhaiensis]|uniref:HTH-type transcriptional regulatory protein TyrR n=1 Tax=Thalassotalea nanhaiensis TaxID=3065648 RepID=A0ABY9TLM7_9GAMM|nr:sigma 54-interacting transcriptional regulator [Colwelliaceae bacterium SQ345]